MALPLMPKATAVWLIDNTMLSFRQIAEFCGLHPLAIQGMADGEVDQNIVGLDPVANSQLTRAEIERCEKDTNANLVLRESAIPIQRQKKGARYTPVSKRQDRPAAIAWILRHHPELTDAQIRRLLGTTKDTINKIRDRTHWNMTNIKPTDPVSLGICTQTELAALVSEAADRRRKMVAEKPDLIPETHVEHAAPSAAGRLSAEAAIASAALGIGKPKEESDEEDVPTVDSVFGKSED